MPSPSSTPLRLDWRPYCRRFRYPMQTAHGSWTERHGIILRLTDSEGRNGFGEIAPLPDFGTETMDDAVACLRELGATLPDAPTQPDDTSRSIPRRMLCLRSAIECARLQLDGRITFPSSGRLSIAALMVGTGNGVENSEAEDSINELLAAGYRTFKAKLAGGDCAAYSANINRWLKALPDDGRLRVDANGGLDADSATVLLQKFSQDPRFEYLEQPLPSHDTAGLIALASNFGPKLALDESVTGWGSLLRCSREADYGYFVVKPALLGQIEPLLRSDSNLRKRLVFSSAMETMIGWSWTARLTAECQSPSAAGLGTAGYFNDDGLGPIATGPWLDMGTLGSECFHEVWKWVDVGTKAQRHKGTKTEGKNLNTDGDGSNNGAGPSPAFCIPPSVPLCLCASVPTSTSTRPLRPGTRILINERDPAKLLAGLFMGLSQGCHVFLANPDWGEDAWRQVMLLAAPEVIIGEPSRLLPTAFCLLPSASPPPFQLSASVPLDLCPYPSAEEGRIFIATGGTGGRIRFAVHSRDTLTIAARSQVKAMGDTPHRACIVLPLFHVGGLMSVWRALVSQGEVRFLDWKQLMEPDATRDASLDGFSLSLVPTQLKRLMDSPNATVLNRFATIFLGGGPCPENLLSSARSAGIRLAPCYGMTETAAMVALMNPDAFLEGGTGVGSALSHAEIVIRDTHGNPAAPMEVGEIVIRTTALCLALLPGGVLPSMAEHVTGDIGYLDERGSLHIKGRNDALLITGGEKVSPALVEDAVMRTGLVEEAIILGIPDEHWGHAVTLLYVPKVATTTPLVLREALRGQLSVHEVPKYWLAMDVFPRNAMGKVDRALMESLAIAQAKPL
ncbi:MAG: o-succinylbenzoate synthase [Verrucomicrobiota bacterium]|nr:o-succinylbenzoate synthase [Verrucomicrobiota bacterium]